LAILGAFLAVGATPEDEAAAAGEKWLVLLDNHKYEDSWKQAGSMFRGEVTQEQWVGSLEKFREPLGASVTRKATRVNFAKTLRAAPDGDYAIIHYTTDFTNKSTVTERLTLVKEDGRWQAAAYAIH
jgi:hypothetical protein